MSIRHIIYIETTYLTEVSEVYELFVLGELMTGEKHGYMLQDVLNNAVGLGRKISSGTLYPLLSRMTEAGWIHLRIEEETKGGRTRKIYAITDAGRERFEELMKETLEPNPEAEAALIFRFKMVYFGYVTKEIRLACLEDYLQIIRRSREYVSRFEAYLQSQKPEPAKQRNQLLRMFDYRKRLGEADEAWIMAEIERIQAEED